MFKLVAIAITVTVFLLTAVPTNAFETPADAESCRVDHKQFLHEMAIANAMLIKADQSSYPISGFITHTEAFNMREWVRAYSAEGSDAFYELPKNADAARCKRLESNLTNGAYWIAEFLIARNPNRCAMYGKCN